MKVIKVKSCLTCPYLGALVFEPKSLLGEKSICLYNKESPHDIEKVTIIPDWCPLEDK